MITVIGIKNRSQEFKTRKDQSCTTTSGEKKAKLILKHTPGVYPVKERKDLHLQLKWIISFHTTMIVLSSGTDPTGNHYARAAIQRKPQAKMEGLTMLENDFTEQQATRSKKYHTGAGYISTTLAPQ